MTHFALPQVEDASANNQAMFDKLQSALGMVPNLYTTIVFSDAGLENYLTFQNGKTSSSKKEKEAVNLVVSQVNDCRYCQAAHTLLGKMIGCIERQTIEIRNGEASLDLNWKH